MTDTSIERVDLPTCGRCAFYLLDPRNLKQGLCRRFPPQYSAVATPRGIVEMVAFPAVHVDMPGCGEFKAKFAQ